MPRLFKVNGIRFFFFSNEGNEPIHVHVEKAEKYAKFWLNPICLARNLHFSSTELGKIRDIIEDQKSEIERKWKEHFNVE